MERKAVLKQKGLAQAVDKGTEAYNRKTTRFRKTLLKNVSDGKGSLSIRSPIGLYVGSGSAVKLSE